MTHFVVVVAVVLNEPKHAHGFNFLDSERGKAIAIQEYCPPGQGRKLIECATDIRLRAERNAGQL
jgi:hypothetical protein